MRFISLIVNIAVVVNVVRGTFLNQYPRFKLYNDGGNPGGALYLTKYIENGDIQTARRLALVIHPEITIPSYSGYFTVNKKYNSNLFFWFFPAKVNAENAPVVLWLQGGPGASSLFGLFTENGPFSIGQSHEKKFTWRSVFGFFTRNSQQMSTHQLIPRLYSWHLHHNLIYIDNPVGTGFSFTDSDDGYAKNENDVGENLLRALQQFFLLFPNLQKNEFFVTGESYGGKYVPAIAYAIYQDNKRKDNPQKPKINLKGLAIGNGITDPIYQFNYGDLLYQLGLIDSNGHEQFMRYQNEGIECMKNRNFACAYDVFEELLDDMDQYPQGSLFKNLTGFNSFYNFLKTDDNFVASLGDFLQKTETRRAIHVGNNVFHDLIGENKVDHHLKLDIMDSVADWVAELLSHYSVLVYNGQLDLICAYPGTVNYLRHLNFSAADEYKSAKRHIWRVDNQIAGYVKQAGNLTEILVRNAGHMVPSDQPRWALDMLLRFTYHKGFQ